MARVSSVASHHIQDNICIPWMASRVLRDMPPTYLVSPRCHHRLPTFRSCSNTLYLDLTCFLTCLCFSTGCSLAFSAWSPRRCLLVFQNSIWVSSLQRETFSASPSLSPPLSPHSVQGSLTHDPYKQLRVFAGPSLSLIGSWGPCKQGLGFSMTLFQCLSLLSSFPVNSKHSKIYPVKISLLGIIPTYARHVPECSKQHFLD